MIDDLPYKGKPSLIKCAAPVKLPALNLDKVTDPAGYLPDDGLVDAVNVALMLRQPLLLTGGPGTGKTQLAFSVAWELGLDVPLMFETKSTSISRDLLYSFDSLRRFQAAHAMDRDIDPRQFIQFGALGVAILHTLTPKDIADLVPHGFMNEAPKQSVVLIDEIDKAPRDFPNDLLNEIEGLYFRIPELGDREVRANSGLRPIVIITSNSEKSLPDAFLRRCIFYNIPFPDESRLEEIVLTRVVGITAEREGILAEVLDFFGRLRQSTAHFLKRPGTAELLNWAAALIGFGINPRERLRLQSDRAVRTLLSIALIA